jgi:hypothetical protein
MRNKICIFTVWDLRFSERGLCLLGCDATYLVNRYQHFGGTCCLHLQGKPSVIQKRELGLPYTASHPVCLLIEENLKRVIILNKQVR